MRTFVGMALMAMGAILGSTAGTAAPPDVVPSVSAKAAVLIDARTGSILFEKNAFVQMDPASTTKIMTALVVLEHGHLDTPVTVSREADRTSGSSLHIHQGDQYTRLDLLRGLLLRSGNDASVALAESDAGSVQEFVAEMNRRASQLGAFNTAYENTHGLTRSGHYSSAYDLALITRAAFQYSVFREIVGLKEATIRDTMHERTRTLSNTNQLLYGFPGADGVKTGTTDAAGKCVVGSATRGGQQLIAVVLNSHDRWADAAHLLNWGFSHWKLEEAVTARQPLASRAVRRGTTERVEVGSRVNLWIDVPAGEHAAVVLALPSGLSAPVAVDQRVGFVSITADGDLVCRAGLYPLKAVGKRPLLRRVRRWFWRYPR